jgi:hypothetical protein
MTTTTVPQTAVKPAVVAMLMNRSDAVERLKELIQRRSIELGWPPGLAFSGNAMGLSIRQGQAKAMKIALLQSILADAEKQPRPQLEQAAAGAFLASWEAVWAGKSQGCGRAFRELHTWLQMHLKERLEVLDGIVESWKKAILKDPAWHPSNPSKSLVEEFLLGQAGGLVAEADTARRRLEDLATIGKALEETRGKAVVAIFDAAGGPKPLGVMVAEALATSEAPEIAVKQLRAELGDVESRLMELPEGGLLWQRLTDLRESIQARVREHHDGRNKARQQRVKDLLESLRGGTDSALDTLADIVHRQPLAFPDGFGLLLTSAWSVTREQSIALIVAAFEPTA